MAEAAGGFRPEYVEGLRLLAQACDLYCATGRGRPVVVGGAAVEYYTKGRYNTGDFDLVEADGELFATAAEAVGFIRESRPGRLRRGFYHPDLPIGIDLVSHSLFDGATDREKIGLLLIDDHGVAFPPVEDIIADRLAQFEASQRRDDELLGQARMLAQLADSLDKEYLTRRVQEEGSELGLLSRPESVDRAHPAQP